MLTAEQVIAAQKANVETLFGLTNKAFEGVEKIVELNLQVARAAIGEAAANTKAALSAKDAQEFLTLQAALLQPSAEKAAAYGRHLYDIATGKPLVLVVMIVPGLRIASILRSRVRLISMSSTTASMIQSTSASFDKSSSKLPTVTSRASEGLKKAAGFDFTAASRPAAAKRLRAAPSFTPASPAPGLAPDPESASGGTISSR